MPQRASKCLAHPALIPDLRIAVVNYIIRQSCPDKVFHPRVPNMNYKTLHARNDAGAMPRKAVNGCQNVYCQLFRRDIFAFFLWIYFNPCSARCVSGRPKGRGGAAVKQKHTGR